jgi:hypothetical protein
MHAPAEAQLSDEVAAGAAHVLRKKLVNMLAAAIEGDAEYPSSLKLLGRLKAVENAAQLLLNEILNQQFRALLLDSNEWMANEREGVALLKDIAARAARAQEKNARNPRRGRPKIMRAASDRPSALELCALMVGIIWRAVRHRWPGKNNCEAQCWCERMWIAAGGAPHGAIARDGALTAWRNHLKAAKRYEPPHPVGERISHILSGSAPNRLKPRPGALRRFYVHPRSRGVPQLPE